MLPAVRCEDISKCYRMFERPQDRLVYGLKERLGLRAGAAAAVSTPREFWALRDISLIVEPGETVGIVGANGSGKSTLLQIIAGTVTPTTGSVTTHGRVAALLELGAGFNPEFTGVDNIRMNASILGLDDATIDDRIDDILAFADIGEHVYQPVKTYSSGMFVRLAFAVAIHTRPSVLLVDEALAVGDLAFQAKCTLRIRQMQDDGTSILFVSHDLGAVRALASRALYLSGGRAKLAGPSPVVIDTFVRDVQSTLQSSPSVASSPARSDRDDNSGSVNGSTTPAHLAERFRVFDATRGPAHGSGAARIRFVDVSDAAGRPLKLAEFNAPVTVSIWVECVQACSVSVNYKIRNRQLEAVAGADFLIASHDLLTMVPGALYRVTYETRLPLMHGDYTFRVSVTVPIDKHDRADFLDVVEVTCPFSMLPADRGRIYTHVYLPNSVKVDTANAPE